MRRLLSRVNRGFRSGGSGRLRRCWAVVSSVCTLAAFSLGGRRQGLDVCVGHCALEAGLSKMNALVRDQRMNGVHLGLSQVRIMQFLQLYESLLNVQADLVKVELKNVSSVGQFHR